MKKLVKEVVIQGGYFCLGLVFFHLLFAFVIRPATVEGSSMYPSLSDGDQLILWQLDQEFDLFDVVVFPVGENYWVKRVIGLPGQQVQISGHDLYIDGELVAQPFLAQGGSLDLSSFTQEDICPINGLTDCPVIPQGFYLVLGDNRNNSSDSRHIGLISKEEIVGRAIMRFYPFNAIRLMNE